MVSTFKGIGVGFTPDILDALDAFAKARGMTRAEVIRASVKVGLPILRMEIAPNLERLLTIVEHTQLALSLIIQEQYPADAEHLIAKACSNVREHHG